MTAAMERMEGAPVLAWAMLLLTLLTALFCVRSWNRIVHEAHQERVGQEEMNR